MHETGVVQALLEAAESAAGSGDRVRRMHVRAGALSGLGAASLRMHIGELARERWGRVPDVHVELGADEPGLSAFGATLVSVTVDG